MIMTWRSVYQQIFTHCASHCLNLAISKSCSVSQIRNCIVVVIDLDVFFSHSALRTNVLEKVVEQMRSSNQLVTSKTKRLHHLRDTRWIERHHSLLALVKLLPAIVQYLENMQQDGNAATSKNAASLLNSLKSSTILVSLAVAEMFHLFCHHW